MKHRLIFTAVCLVAMLLNLTPAALGDSPPVISYDSSSTPRITSSESNLFPSFENLMPGDSRTQTIVVKNKNAYKLATYFRCYPIQNGAEVYGEQAEQLMDKLNLTINVGSDDKQVFSGTVADLLQKGSTGSDTVRYLHIATLNRDKEAPIKFNLSLGKDAGNAFAADETRFNFELAVERMSSGGGDSGGSTTTSTSKNPKTGGKSGLWLLASGCASLLGGGLLTARRRQI